jgi:aminoglycoside phosphotransferase (APT) family kinase protein
MLSCLLWLDLVHNRGLQPTGATGRLSAPARYDASSAETILCPKRARLNHPPAEIDLEAATVRRLLEVDCPSLAKLPIWLVDEGWDNFTYRVGNQHAVRLPRRELAVGLIANEQHWLPLLAPRLPLATPVPVYVGKPSKLFPWPWSVVNWIPGCTAENHCFTPDDISVLAETLVALHQPAPEAAPVNPFRGTRVRTKNDVVEERLNRLGQRHQFDGPRLAVVWREVCDAPDAEQRVWLHGDLHPRNVVVRDGSLVGLIDWGDVNGGDPANDMACAWMLIEAKPLRREFLDAYGAEEALVSRAKGWALHIGLALVDSGEPRHVPMGRAALDRVLADA